jgi:hypothetical protein
VLALFGKAGFIHHERGSRVTEFGDDIAAQIIPHRIGVPNVAGEDALDAAWVSVAGVFGQLPAVLAFHFSDEAAEIIGGMPMRFRPREVRAEQGNGLVDHRLGVVDEVGFIFAATIGCNHEDHLLIAVYPLKGTVILRG